MKLILAAALSFACTVAPAIAADETATAAPAPVTAAAARGKMLTAADGARLAQVYRVENGSAQIILDGRMIAVPANTLVLKNNKLTTTLTKIQVINLP